MPGKDGAIQIVSLCGLVQPMNLPVHIFKTAWFAKAARKAGIVDTELLRVVEQVHHSCQKRPIVGISALVRQKRPGQYQRVRLGGFETTGKGIRCALVCAGATVA